MLKIWIFKYYLSMCRIVVQLFLTRVLIAHVLMYGFIDTKHTVTKLPYQQSYNNSVHQNMTKVRI